MSTYLRLSIVLEMGGGGWLLMPCVQTFHKMLCESTRLQEPGRSNLLSQVHDQVLGCN